MSALAFLGPGLMTEQRRLIRVLAGWQTHQRIEGVRFSALEPSDSTYEYFCEVARCLERRQEELDATRIYRRTHCDINDEEPAAEWSTAVLTYLASGGEPGRARVTAAVYAEPARPLAARGGGGGRFRQAYAPSGACFRRHRFDGMWVEQGRAAHRDIARRLRPALRAGRRAVILLRLDEVIDHSERDQPEGAHLGQFAIRAGYLPEVKAGRKFNA